MSVEFHLKSVCFEYLARLELACEWTWMFHLNDLRSTFHNLHMELQYGYQYDQVSGPEMRFWYFVTVAVAQVHGFVVD